MITFPKDTPRLGWTRHIKNKMVFYGISGATILRIFRSAHRREEGIAPGTSAAMRTVKHNRTGKTAGPKETELWVMYKTTPTKRVTMISAWRYPGKTKVGERPLIPDDVLEELEKMS